MACSWFDLACKVKAAATDAAVDAGSQSLQTLADKVSEAAASAFGALGTLWVFTPTPRLDGDSSQGGGSPLPAQLVDVLGYVQWIGLITAVLGLIALGALLGWRTRSDLGEALFPKLALIAGGVMFVGSASSLVGALVGGASERSSATVAFLRGELVSLTLWAAVLATIIAGIRLIRGNAKAGVSWLEGMATLLLVSAASATIGQALVGAMDELSIRIINNSLDCSVTSANCFGATLIELMKVANTTTSGTPTGGVILAIVFGILGLLISFIQMLLMIVRGGMLIVLVGVLPLTASATTTEMGRQWFQRSLGWLIAWALYKPAAAIIYAAGFQLAGSLGKDNSGIWSAVSGLSLMVASAVALPALLRFVAPMTAAVTGGSGAGAAAAGMAMTGVAQGAVKLKGQGVAGGSGSSAPPSPSATAGGADRPPNGSGGGAPARGPSSAPGGSIGPTGAAGRPSGGSAGGLPSSAAGGAPAGGGAAAAAGGGAAAAAGPVGVGVAAASATVQGAKKISRDAAGGAE
jgi:hypothetical protein